MLLYLIYLYRISKSNDNLQIKKPEWSLQLSEN